MRFVVGIVAVLALVPAVAAAENKPAAKDPNRIICERQGDVSSRVATKRVCMTAAEWEIRRREDREALEKAQLNRTSPNGS
jgi:hypothetical protein